MMLFTIGIIRVIRRFLSPSFIALHLPVSELAKYNYMGVFIGVFYTMFTMFLWCVQ